MLLEGCETEGLHKMITSLATYAKSESLVFLLCSTYSSNHSFNRTCVNNVEYDKSGFHNENRS